MLYQRGPPWPISKNEISNLVRVKKSIINLKIKNLWQEKTL